MGREFKAPESISEWKHPPNMNEGAEEIILYTDEKSGTYARILRLAPGYKSADKPMTHPFNEVVYISQGGIVDLFTNTPYPTGYFGYFPAGMEHGPLFAPVGAVFVEFRHYTDKKE